ncbi:sugar kinase [Bacillus sp. FJAT-50079]|uniref:sugar kinase n=1 Tax=Bacillus sp. FJAT-50079 TaxID=2833577 RepID=UPI001BC92AE0|nr:sugar kinase [Bacillus sp. FJAT-50079]MBS4206942.1 sugar kinase [Bacillus sp. FJAT-50079]
MNDVITIGDALITFNPNTKGPMKYVNTFERKVGGAELNFAIGCARLGLKTGWVSRLGNDEFGKHILNFVRGEGIDTSEVKLVDGYPTSLYFKEVLEDGSGRSFYYRSNSPTDTLTEETLNEVFLKQAKVLHITGVFLAVNKDKNISLIKKAVKIAKQNGVLISMDPNIRLRLWTKEEVKAALAELLPYVDILLTGEEEADIMFGTTETEDIIAKSKELGISYLAIKQGEDGAIGYHNGELIDAPPVKAKKVVDTVGAGDGFDAGFVYGILHGWSLEKTLTFATTIGSMVVSVSGDNEGLPYLDDVLIQMGEKEFIER